MKSKDKVLHKKTLSFSYLFSIFSLPSYILIVFILHKALRLIGSHNLTELAYTLSGYVIILLIISAAGIAGGYGAIINIWRDKQSSKRSIGLIMATLAIASEIYVLYELQFGSKI